MTKQLSQTALYGELLTNEQQFSYEVSQISRMTKEEISTSVEQAKQGDYLARNRLIEDALHCILVIAKRISYCSGVDFLDLVQVGNLAALEDFEKAIEKVKDDIIAYLGGIARYAMIDYARMRSMLIVKKAQNYYAPSYEIVSLDVPLDEHGEKQSFAETLAQPVEEQQKERDYTYLYRAVEKLPSLQKETIVSYYGLYDHAHETLEEIEHRRGVTPGTSVRTRQRAISNMQKKLAIA